MKHNAYTLHNPVLYRVWGDDTMPPTVVCPDNTPVFVLWSPTLKQWVMSITEREFRYDALVTSLYFRPDPALAVVTDVPSGPAYYLARLMPNTT